MLYFDRNKIKLLQKEKGWTDQFLADSICRSRALIDQWKKGTSNPSFLDIIAMSNLGGVDVNYFCSTVEDEK